MIISFFEYLLSGKIAYIYVEPNTIWVGKIHMVWIDSVVIKTDDFGLVTIPYQKINTIREWDLYGARLIAEGAYKNGDKIDKRIKE